jgi:hypothetical protein
MSKIRRIVVLTASLMMLTTSVVAQGPGAGTRDYFPLRVGNFWKYRHNEGIEFSYKVVEASKQADGTTLYQVKKSQTVNVNSWYTNANGWVILRKDAYPDHEGLERTYQPPKQILQNPLNPGATWTWKGKTVTQTDGSETSKVVGSERVEVPAGKFRAMKVVSTIRDGESTKTVTNWYVDGVGLVKSWTEAGPFKYGWELVEYNFKK